MRQFEIIKDNIFLLCSSSIRPISATTAGTQTPFLPGATARKHRGAILLGSIVDFPGHGFAFASDNIFVIIERTKNRNCWLESSWSHHQWCYWKWENLRGAPARRVQLLWPITHPHCIRSQSSGMHL